MVKNTFFPLKNVCFSYNISKSDKIQISNDDF